MNILVEAIVVGLVLTIIATPTLFLTQSGIKEKGFYSKDYLMLVITLFMVGMIVHLLFEFAGANKWYCKHGHACSS